MEAKIKKCIIKEIKDAEWGNDDLQVICESIIDIANMSALEILQSNRFVYAHKAFDEAMYELMKEVGEKDE